MITIVNANSPKARYLEEILDHAGMSWTHLNQDWERIIIVHANEPLGGELKARIGHEVRTGAALICVGGTAGLDDLVGASESESINEGYIVSPNATHAITARAHDPLHIFGGWKLRTSGGSSLGSFMDGGDAINVNSVGRGVAVAFGPDISWSVAHIQTGIPVDADADPAPDGSAPLNDDILKAEDGLVLSWDEDRYQTHSGESLNPSIPGIDVNYPNGDTPWFSVPVADELRDLLLRAIAWAANEIGAPLTCIDAWPEGTDAVGMISHDSDLNVDAHAQTTLKLLDQAGVKSTWCHMWGPTYDNTYESSTFARVINAGHELALHYNAFDRDGGSWGQEHLKSQAAVVRNEAGVDVFMSNKNHYTRWEGRTEFYGWLIDEGIQIDQSRGPSKKGTVGYPFGSCLPSRPINPETGQFYDILELPFQFQDLWLTTPEYQSEATIAQARRHHGVAHFLFHQIHLHTKPQVAAAFLAVIERGREAGLEWWRCADINDWERSRRKIRVTVDGGSLEVRNAPASHTAVALVLSKTGEEGTFERYGQHWRAVPLNEGLTSIH